MPNTTKIPCGGFYLGDGLAMEGDTLKSLGGTYVKVGTNDGETFEFMDDSPLKTFEEIRQKGKTSPVTLLMYSPDAIDVLLCSGYSDDLIGFHVLRIIEDRLIHIQVLIDSDNKITLSQSLYTLTPTT